jgi:hypothetical protein
VRVRSLVEAISPIIVLTCFSESILYCTFWVSSPLQFVLWLERNLMACLSMTRPGSIHD